MFSRATALQSTCSTTGILALRSKGSKRMPSGDGQPRHSLGRAGGRAAHGFSVPTHHHHHSGGERRPPFVRERSGCQGALHLAPQPHGCCGGAPAAIVARPSWRGHLTNAVLPPRGRPARPAPGSSRRWDAAQRRARPPSRAEQPRTSSPQSPAGPGAGRRRAGGGRRCSPPPRHITS